MRVYILILSLILESQGVNKSIRTGAPGSCKYEHDRSDGLVQSPNVIPRLFNVSARGTTIFFISFFLSSVLSYYNSFFSPSFSSFSNFFPSICLFFSVTTAIYTGTLQSPNINKVLDHSGHIINSTFLRCVGCSLLTHLQSITSVISFGSYQMTDINIYFTSHWNV